MVCASAPANGANAATTKASAAAALTIVLRASVDWDSVQIQRCQRWKINPTSHGLMEIQLMERVADTRGIPATWYTEVVVTAKDTVERYLRTVAKAGKFQSISSCSEKHIRLTIAQVNHSLERVG